MSGLDSLYQDLILDHARRRSGEGAIEPFDAEHFEKNPSCGDEITLRVRLDGDRIDAIGWTGDGCSISMASASILVDQLLGRPVADARLGVDTMRAMLRSRGAMDIPDDSPEAEIIGDAIALEGVGKYVMRVKCAMLGWVALEAALREAEAA
ncbi:Fe-S cluster assembly sulfur transfer protein SufU [Gulosibacter sp. 10]|uniref:Fe-S cluster assembly sulfur transfer protein SufU n=1 Tax=Gulosibacter sp. 10 TaxID=1255570 RepID=UPI00097EC863|nr:SUF system NifU family Fe-S cluster assembly protein [Gulosibacter sp. 10]SJM70338.1 Putative iron-sulfur cluster assembly scaffold protein for SUF system, SufE2 [Gulosibacter sp. 10]